MILLAWLWKLFLLILKVDYSKTNDGLIFSVVIPSFNRYINVKDQINRLTFQKCSLLEVIIVAQGDLCPVEQVRDFPLHFIHFAHAIGVSRARNEGARVAKGRFLIFLDDDDLPANDWLGSFTEMMESNPDADVLFCGARNFTNGVESRILPEPGTMKPYLAGTWAMRRSLFEKLGGYDERFSFSENTELLLRAQLANCLTASINQVKLTYYPAVSGGSRNLQNKVSGCLLMLEKHRLYFKGNPKVKKLFLRMAGVALIQLGRRGEARKLLWQSWLITPWEPKAFLRLLLAILPLSFSRSVYKKRVAFL